jgi:Anti-anti-sigma regulatory factor (antagonist of anti-sigma factor)
MTGKMTGNRRLDTPETTAADVIYQDVQLRVVRTGPRAVAFHGEIDVSNSRAVAEALALVRGTSSDAIVADLGGLTFVDVSGMRVLALPRLKVRDRWLWLCNIPPNLRRLLVMLGWDPERALDC